ncbi:MAG: hypothetical protein AUF79_08535 [Crenarchaeota archaeon 13_1_20CM_2_51_8]|nr:MAG: hypothetical protein AUF79_08535 [Crenarchaeota archaeon 13_1_20CM_2_51_8]
MDQLQIHIFNSQNDEFNGLTTSGQIDLTDTALSAAQCTQLQTDPNFLVASTCWGYRSNWRNVVDATGVSPFQYALADGIPNFYTLLNMNSQTPATPGTIRWGFSAATTTLNPYRFSSTQESAVVHEIYDTLYKPNPVNPSQVLDWMTVKSQVFCSGAGGPRIHNVLRPDNFWQDGQPVTAWDVKFSYKTMQVIPTSQYTGLNLDTLLTGAPISVSSRTEFDIKLAGTCPPSVSDMLQIGSLTIVPGHLWSSSCSGITWTNDVNAGSVPNSCMTASGAMTAAAFDPLSGGVLVGSGPWMCVGACSSTGTQSPPPGGMFTLTRFGIGTVPGGHPTVSEITGGSCPSCAYFRSSGSLALSIWTGYIGCVNSVSASCNASNAIATNPVDDSTTNQVSGPCFGAALGTFGCVHWQQGIGAPGGNAIVGSTQVGEMQRFYCVSVSCPYFSQSNVNYDISWISPFLTTGWGSLTGIVSFPPVLFEGSATLNPCSIDPVNGYDC